MEGNSNKENINLLTGQQDQDFVKSKKQQFRIELRRKKLN